MAKKQGRTSNFISYILFFLIAIGLIGFLAHYTGGFTSSFKTFSIECDGKEISTSASGFETTVNKPLVVKVKYNFDSKASGYSLKVVPNALAGKDFDFTLDGDVYSFQAERDLTEGFNVEYEEDSFTLTPKGNLTEILQAIYPNKVVEDCVQYGYKDMFTLVITSYNGEANVYLNFSVPEKVVGVELSQEVIVFWWVQGEINFSFAL